MIKDIIRQIFKDKFASVALIILLFIYLCILMANFIAPYSKDFSDRNLSYAPPSTIYLIDEKGELSKPYFYNFKRTFEPKLYQNIYTLDTETKHYLKFFIICQFT